MVSKFELEYLQLIGPYSLAAKCFNIIATLSTLESTFLDETIRMLQDGSF